MKANFPVPSRTALTLVCGLTFAAGIAVFHAKADEWDKKTILTVSQTIQVRETVLEPGQYVLKLYNSNSDRHVVQIFNADQSHLINTVMAVPAERMQPTGDSQFTFWETPAGKARALRAWYYPGDNFGQEFPYPKHLADVAMASATTTTTPAPAPAVTETQPAETQPSTQAETRTEEERTETQQPVETAQAAPPPAPQPETPAAQPEPAPQPARELPKTSSPYPTFGAIGLVLLGLYTIIRIKRLA
jgi:hypothetical protein